MKTFILDRVSSGPKSTLGIMYGPYSSVSEHTVQKKFICFTIEDRFNVVKVSGETRIPSGSYILKFNVSGGMNTKYSQMFLHTHSGMIELQDVNNFTNIYIHMGNTDIDTHGCILVGDSSEQNLTKNGFVGNSRQCYERVYPIISFCIKNGDTQLVVV